MRKMKTRGNSKFEISVEFIVSQIESAIISTLKFMENVIEILSSMNLSHFPQTSN